MPNDVQAAVERWLPMKPVMLHILLALAEQDSHAYGIIQKVRERSQDRLRLETGPLYRHLRKLLEDGLVEETEVRPPDDDPRRGAYYALTRLGIGVIAAESRRLEGLVSLTKELGLVSRRWAD